MIEEPDKSEFSPDRSPAGSRFPAGLPLFPLDLVLFPTMLLPLHIFEERYKEMVDRCVRESIPFGIVLATGIDSRTGQALTADVGCMARIARVERLPDGRMNIEVIGESRFRLSDVREDLAYRTADVDAFDDRPADADAVVPLADEVQRLLRDFLTRSLAVSGQSVPDFELPDDPQQLSFTAAWVLPVEMSEKQDLLAVDDTVSRLVVERDVLLREVTRLRRAAESQQTLWVQIRYEAFEKYLCAN
jgi:Lon protease-like protein